MYYLANAFSLNMLPGPCSLLVDELDEEDLAYFRKIFPTKFCQNCVGHQAAAEIISAKLGVDVPVNRIAVKAEYGDKIVVFQITERLPEGAVISREEMARIPAQWWLVTIGPVRMRKKEEYGR